MITLNEQQLSELNNHLLEMPTRHGYPLIQWFKLIDEEQNPKTEEQTEEKTEETELNNSNPYENPLDSNGGLG
jgi:hypothetical protein